MNEGIPLKGQMLTEISKFWFDFTKDIIDNHLITTNVKEFPEECRKYGVEITGRSMLVKKAELIPLECIVRGFISGSGWKDYQKTGSICGIKLPSGMVESEKISEPIFTPSTKAEIGDHDENISENKAIDLVGREVYDMLKEKALQVYKAAYDYALEKGIIIADTKMEFGFYKGKIILIDELLTPDSSRFWPHDKYLKGRSQESYDKQYVRDYLQSINFNKQPPAPTLPDEVIINTSRKYQEALDQLMGK
jgi:phosphoribosylaminoimidazole-succinocarboxamide synthase